jgi:hypothetical protein
MRPVLVVLRRQRRERARHQPRIAAAVSVIAGLWLAFLLWFSVPALPGGHGMMMMVVPLGMVVATAPLGRCPCWSSRSAWACISQGTRRFGSGANREVAAYSSRSQTCSAQRRIARITHRPANQSRSLRRPGGAVGFSPESRRVPA